MKVAAHPMLVAVALGLLGPNALANDATEEERTRRSSEARDTAPATDGLERESLMSALEDEEGPYWTRLDLKSDEADAWSPGQDYTVE